MDRLTAVVGSLRAEVQQGHLAYLPDANGIQRPRINPMPRPEGTPDFSPVFVIQGSNVFRFNHDELEDAQALADQINSALNPMDRNFRRQAAAEIKALLEADTASPPTKATRKKRA